MKNPVMFRVAGGKMNLTLGVTIREESGAVIYDGGFSFIGGTKLPNKGIIPGIFATTDDTEIKCLRNHSGNVANGGELFEEIIMPSKEDFQEFPGISKFQVASDLLRTEFGAKASDVNSKKSLLETAEKLKVKFPDLE